MPVKPWSQNDRNPAAFHVTLPVYRGTETREASGHV
jgi:hypothetical protein